MVKESLKKNSCKNTENSKDETNINQKEKNLL